ADFAEERAASSVLRAWSTWNGFFQFWVAEQVVEGNPMSAVPRPRVRASSPKPLRGEDTAEQLLRALAQGARKARDPWPERDLAVLALALLTGMRWAEMLALRVESIGGRGGERRVRGLGEGGVGGGGRSDVRWGGGVGGWGRWGGVRGGGVGGGWARGVWSGCGPSGCRWGRGGGRIGCLGGSGSGCG